VTTQTCVTTWAWRWCIKGKHVLVADDEDDDLGGEDGGLGGQDDGGGQEVDSDLPELEDAATNLVIE